jgi:hypothetical protein
MGVKYLSGLVLGILSTTVAGLASADVADIVVGGDVSVLVSEPSTLALFGIGFVALVLLRRSAKNR